MCMVKGVLNVVFSHFCCFYFVGVGHKIYIDYKFNFKIMSNDTNMEFMRKIN